VELSERHTDEVVAINSILTGHNWYCSLDTGSAATEEKLLAMSGNNAPEIMHIATHGFLFAAPKKKIEIM